MILDAAESQLVWIFAKWMVLVFTHFDVCYGIKIMRNRNRWDITVPGLLPLTQALLGLRMSWSIKSEINCILVQFYVSILHQKHSAIDNLYSSNIQTA